MITVLLDVIAPLIIGPGKILLFMALAIALEAVILALFRYHNIMGVVVDSLLINVVSFIVGFVLQKLYIIHDLRYIYDMDDLFLPFILTVISEAIVLLLRNRNVSRWRLLSAVLVINIFSYGMFVLMFDPFNR